ncbi:MULTISPECIES: iron ABC transporter permease [unclassified Paenibacillus]|uniref:ABC transporter permease n=1 Tax=unclassified Paenibacillus TaxID=185978 RepID=UPI001AEAF1B8|nr:MULTISPECIES: iron ABC transporter permease [unclassified Paenibacillus]MBP1155402.1 iron(III) transport system permease protein [Paenibacillus sp. PvP091]MBP1169213.1 iron(III) transport system permease protein [Paenibacillus sp. PvR098]MBP2440241.1 iron(III) transport system permease protein [Paenibacillus sp. PvP052]
MAKVMGETASKSKGIPFQGRSLFYTLMLMMLAISVLYPLILLLINSFVITMPDGNQVFGIGNWIIAWQQPGMVESIINTFNRVFITELIAFPIAIFVVWLIARTDIPWKGCLDFFMWVAFFLPALPVLMGWILLLDPKFGLVNQMFINWFGMKQGPFNIYTFWGIVWMHLVTKSVAAKYILMLPAFRNMDASLEEASHMSGYGKVGTIIHTVIPMMMPTILISLIISLIHNLESFETEIILGPPGGFYVFSTKIYQLIMRDQPLYGAATVLGIVILLSITPLILYQYWISTKRKFITVTSHFKPAKIRLGSMKWPAFSFVFMFGLLITVVPAVFLLMGTFMKLFGFFTIEQPWTLQHWHQVLNDPILIHSIWNTVKLALGVAVGGMLWFSLLAYISVRSKFKFRGTVDFLTWLPACIPGILLGLGMLWMFLETPLLRTLYGTIFVLIIVVLISSMTTGVQLIKSNMVQLHSELEEASAVSGGSWLYTYRRVLLPILAPALLSVGIITFITASRSVAQITMLVTSKNRPLSILQLDYMVDGKYEAAAISGVFVVLLTIGVAILARTIGKKFGIKI